MNRNEALTLLGQHLKKDAMIKHSLASEAIMRGLAGALGFEEGSWALAGLLHDIDFEYTENEPQKHGIVAMSLLPDDIPAPVREAIMRHNEANGSKRAEPIDFALAAGESITGLIIATALIYPDKKLSSVKTKSVAKRMKEKAFARNVSRECIMECEKIGLELPRFIELSIESMQKISTELGL